MYVCIYSDEYVVLRGDHVQPEFLMHIGADTARSLDEAEIEATTEARAHAGAVMEAMISPELHSCIDTLISSPSPPPSTSEPGTSPATAPASTLTALSRAINRMTSERDADTALSVLALQRQVALVQVDAAVDRFTRARGEVNRDMFSI